VAISNNRLLDIENGRVSFEWKDYRAGGQAKTMTLSADEFIFSCCMFCRMDSSASAITAF